MSMSTHVEAFAPPDDKWKKMKAVWDSCQKAGIVLPIEVEVYFNGEEPDEAGVKIELKDDHPAISEYSADSASGYEIDLTKLPAHIKIIRVVNSY